MAAKKPSADFEHIGPVMDRLLKRYEGIGGNELARVRHAWNRVVGQPTCRNAQPAAISKKTLLVHVTSSPWIHQLQFLKKDILRRLNEELKNFAVEDLLFKIGPV